jgi:hypothetical protein
MPSLALQLACGAMMAWKMHQPTMVTTRVATQVREPVTVARSQGRYQFLLISLYSHAAMSAKTESSTTSWPNEGR